MEYCKEVYYTFKEKDESGPLDYKTMSGGWELRNKIF